MIHGLELERNAMKVFETFNVPYSVALLDVFVYGSQTWITCGKCFHEMHIVQSGSTGRRYDHIVLA